MAYPFVESPNVTPATARRIDVVVMHTMEIAERKDAAEICARWFATPVSKVSAHYCVDADTVVQCVREKDIAWHARGGNTASVGVELAGFARQTRKDWADAYSTAVLAGRRPWWRMSAAGARFPCAGSSRVTSRPGDAGSPGTPR